MHGRPRYLLLLAVASVGGMCCLWRMEATVRAVSVERPVPSEQTPVAPAPGPEAPRPPRPPLLGCGEIATEVVESHVLGAGRVNVVKNGTWKGRPVIIKQYNTKDHYLPDKLRREFFMNQINFAKLRLQHPNLMDVYGICEGPPAQAMAVVVEALPVKLSHANINQGPRKAQREEPPQEVQRLPLETRLRMLLGVAQFLQFMSEASALRPGSPYILCDVNLLQFMVSSAGVVKFTDYDMIVPMRPDPRYPFHHVFPHILYNSTPAAAHPPPGPPRLYTGRECDKRRRLCGYPCFFNALDNFRWRASEYKCTADQRCPGLGPKASSFWFAHFFLDLLLPEAGQDAALRRMKEKALDLREAERPSPDDILRTLEGYAQHRGVPPPP
eukprot:EG_transcript_13328